MSGVKITDERSYLETLKKLLNLQFQYSVVQLGDIFLQHIQQLLRENSVLASEVKKILGDNLTDVTTEIIEQEKKEFLLQCKQAKNEGIPLFLEYLLDVFETNSFESHCVRLMFVFEMDKCYSSMAALLQDGWEYGYVTPYLAQITYEEKIDSVFVHKSFSTESLLRRFFIKSEIGEKITLLNRVELRERVIDFAIGNVSIYTNYLKFMQKRNYDASFEVWLGEERNECSFLEEVLENREQKKKQIVYVYGEEGCGKKISIFRTCKKRGENCVLINLDEYYKEIHGMDVATENAWVDEVLCEIVIFQSVPIIELHVSEKLEIMRLLEECKLLIKRLLDTFSVIFLCAKQKVNIEESYPVTYLYMKPMSLLETKKFWELTAQAYVLEEDMFIGTMANKFQLTQGKIRRIFENAEKKRIQRKETCITEEIITEECYEVIEQNMGKKAVKVPAAYRMEDLILPKKQKQKLLDACNQVRYKYKVYEEWGFQKKVSYGKGVSMAFVGPPGTGKTMAAQVIAKELGMELYKVELSAIVSKYVGETEKNMDEIFEQARKSQVILFFDEADALFSKRSEGKETTDKYSNMEAAFLLQKMEAYEGITILATNLFHHFDEAFKRRLKMIVEFPLPDEKDRKRLWQTMLPSEMKVGEIDFDYLAKQFELSGSNIRNILLHSAFLAAAKGKCMDMEEIIPAIKNEYAKNGKNLLKEDVSEYYMYLE